METAYGDFHNDYFRDFNKPKVLEIIITPKIQEKLDLLKTKDIEIELDKVITVQSVMDKFMHYCRLVNKEPSIQEVLVCEFKRQRMPQDCIFKKVE